MESSFGAFLKQKRQEKHLTQKELAKLLYVSESAVSKWEKDVSHPDITLLPNLSKILDVSEHEIITASIDKKSREEKVQAKKWRTLSLSWNLFFYISYGVALIPCFICNLAINHTLSWFWIVVCSLLLAFTFTCLPSLVKKHRLLILPLSMFGALCLLLGVCAIYTSGAWFFVATVSTLFGLMMIFVPIYIAKYDIFKSIRKYNDFISVAILFFMLLIMLAVIEHFTLVNGYSSSGWLYFSIVISTFVYMFLNLLLSVRFIKTNRFIKSSLILFIISTLYTWLPFIKVSNPYVQSEIDSLNIWQANIFDWSLGIPLERNIHLMIFLTLVVTALILGLVGIVRTIRSKNK
jgi:transcriptional regulator with XRE-family HTH domain